MEPRWGDHTEHFPRTDLRERLVGVSSNRTPSAPDYEIGHEQPVSGGRGTTDGWRDIERGQKDPYGGLVLVHRGKRGMPGVPKVYPVSPPNRHT